MEVVLDLKREIVEICRRAYANKLFAGTSGNLSVYCPKEGHMLITPTSVRYETMEAADIVALTLSGEVLEGLRKPSSEWRMHAALYELCPQVSVVFHTHSPYATAFAALRRSIPLALVEMLYFLGGEVFCARFEKPGTRELGLAALEALQGRHACLLASHGVVAVGASLEEAFLRAEYVEDAAMICHRALQIGRPVVLSPDDTGAGEGPHPNPGAK